MAILLLIAGAALVYALQNWLYRNYWNYKLTARIDFQAQPVLEGESAALTEVIENRKLLPLPFLNVKFQISRNLRFQNMENTSVSDYNYKNDIFSMLFHQRITRVLTFECGKRGYYSIDQVDLISSNLLMTGNLVVTQKQNTHFYVYPRDLDISELDVPFKKMMGSLASRQFLYEDPFEFRGIRDYSMTDPMNSVNWKASAKTGSLMVNVHDSTVSQEVVIFLNVEDETIWKYDDLHEIAIRITSALSYRFLSAAIPTRIVCNGSDQLTNELVVLPAGTGKRQINAINEVLARIDLTLPAFPCIDLVKEEAARKNSSHPLYVMISNSMNQSLQQAFLALARTGSGALWIAPLYEDMELLVSQDRAMDVLRWEVSKYAA